MTSFAKEKLHILLDTVVQKTSHKASNTEVGHIIFKTSTVHGEVFIKVQLKGNLLLCHRYEAYQTSARMSE